MKEWQNADSTVYIIKVHSRQNIAEPEREDMNL